MKAQAKNSIFNYINSPNLLTLMNGACGISAVFAAIRQRLFLAIILLVCSGLFDLFDGRLARKLNLASEFGKQLDSLADLISFIVAPAVIAFVTFKEISVFDIAVLIYFVASGLLRLARFNVTGMAADQKWFEGMPVPCSLLVLMLFLSGVHAGIDEQLALLLFFFSGILMTSVLKVRKL